MMRATKVDREPPQARNAALIAKRARRIPLHPPLCAASSSEGTAIISQRFRRICPASGFVRRMPVQRTL